ncbi:hypothetical protein GCM10023189_07990 [Nibrella saemangeumensis]|uniref:DUF5615 domain-containing protein n=1 Tax=Nibrella saemangeumensis TaxID=1084526 RepID=A0ABP8MHJ5_9BACT
MQLNDLRLLSDENISPVLLDYLLERGCDVVSVEQAGLTGASDVKVLEWAYQELRVILTQDSDFGKLAFVHKKPFIGIIRLWPGHLLGRLHLPTLEAVSNTELVVDTPFVIVAEKTGDTIQIRMRNYAK